MNSSASLRVRRDRASARDERGQVVLLMALGIVAIVGVAALAIDASFMYEKRNRLHAAADAAAKSMAMEVRRGNFSSGSLLAYAQREVTAQGFNNSVIQSVNCPPSTGAYTGGVCGTTSSYVEVILQETTATFFASVLSFTSMAPGARAVAGSAISTTCLIALGTSGVGLNLSNNAVISAPNCNLAVNSTSTGAITLTNNARITALSVGVTGTATVSNNATITPTAQIGVPPSSDPLAALAAPTVTSPCTTNSATPGNAYTLTNNASATISAGTYCGFSISNNSTLNLNAGVYSIGAHGINIANNSRINGTGGVLIYNYGGGEIFIGNNAQLNIVAPTTGTWAGIGIFQPSSNTRTLNVSNNARYTVSGVSYTPNAQFRVFNNAVLDGACMVIVALSMNIENNGGTLASNCSAFGGNPLRKVAIAE